MKPFSFAMSLALTGSLMLVPAAADTTLIGSVASNTLPAFQELAAAYGRKHPGTTIHFVPAGSKTIITNLNRGLPSDFVVISDAFIGQTQNLIDPEHVLVNRTVIVVSPAAKGKITKPEDLAAAGVRLGDGSPGEALQIFTEQTFANLDAKYGNGLAAKLKANVSLHRIDDAQIAVALKSGKIDAAILLAADAVDDGLESIEIGESAVKIVNDAAIVKGSDHIAEAKDFLAFVRSPEGAAIIRKHGHDT